MKVNTDLLIIGGGGAACASAIEAAKYDVNPVVIDKGIVGRSGSTPTSGSGINAAFDHLYLGCGDTRKGDNPEVHYNDTRMVGNFLNDPRLVNIVVNEIAQLIQESENWGVCYNRASDGRYIQQQPMGNSFPRSIVGIGGGPSFMEVLRKEALHRGVRVIENTMIVELIVRNGRVCGALGINVLTGEWCFIRAKAVVLAAGSATGLYKYASANFKTTGDTYVLAYHAGARLANMEFVEFTVIPKVGNAIISSGGISPFVGRGSHLINVSGERFLVRYDPERMERTSRSLLTRAIFLELKEGRGPVFNDSSHFSDDVWADFEKTDKPRLQRLKAAGLDYRKEKFEWIPAVHTFLGGVVIDTNCFTGVPGLFAAGECTSSIHGSDRLAGNALSECLVFGKKAGRNASIAALVEEAPVIDNREFERVLRKYTGTMDGHEKSASFLKKRLRDIAWLHLGVIRNASSIMEGLEKLEQIKRGLEDLGKAGDTNELIMGMEVRNLAFVGEMIANAALMRTESRGQHFREDYPEKDDAKWMKWLVLHKGKKGGVWSTVQVPKNEGFKGLKNP